MFLLWPTVKSKQLHLRQIKKNRQMFLRVILFIQSANISKSNNLTFLFVFHKFIFLKFYYILKRTTGCLLKSCIVSISRTEFFFPETDNGTGWSNSSMGNSTGEPYLIVIGTELRTNKHYYKVWKDLEFWKNYEY